MVYYIAIPLKKSSDVDLVKPLKNLISSYYSTSDEPIDCTDALNELNKLRSSATFRTLDKHESSLEIMGRYYDQLRMLETKCPPHDVSIPFKWKDAFEKGTIFGTPAGLTISSFGYEMSCVLFNLGAMHSHIAAVKASDIVDDDALKVASKHFQMSSGIYQYLKSGIINLLGNTDTTTDLFPETLGALQALMLAQAQECFLHKAIGDNMKDGILAKVASQCEDLYGDALKQMQRDSIKNIWDKEWLPVVASKRALYGAMAEYFQSLVNKAAKDIGEELARLQHAQELIRTAESRGGIHFTGKEYVAKIRQACEAAQKDNDFIYHARVPDHKSLSPIGKAVLAKPTALPERFSSNFQDLFVNLLPVAVQQAVQVFDVRKTDIVNTDLGRIREQNQLLNAVLASLNLPAALEDFGGQSLPQSIQDKIQEVQEKGGAEALRKKVSELPILLERNREILQEAERLLKEEEVSDNHFRSQFKEKWTRTPSEKLNSNFRTTASKYHTILDNAMNADKSVRDKFESFRVTLDLMARPQEQILAMMPSGGGSATTGSAAAARLRQLMAEVDKLRKERERIEADFNSVSFDMKAQFLEALAQEGVISEANISSRTLDQGFKELRQQVENSVARQEALVAEIQKVSEEFAKNKVPTPARDQVLKEIAEAYDAFLDMSFQLEKGTEFYGDVTHMLMEFQQKVSDFCFARRTEQEDKCRDIQQTIAGQVQKPPTSMGTSAMPKSAPSKPPLAPYVPPSAASSPYSSQATSSAPPASVPPTANPANAPYAARPYYAPASSNPPYPTFPTPPYNPYATYPPPMSSSMHSGYPYGQPYPPMPTPGTAYAGYPYPTQPQQAPAGYPYPYGQPTGYPQQPPPQN